MSRDKPKSLKTENEKDKNRIKGTPILKTEVEQAIKDMKNKKSTEIDELPIKFLNYLHEEVIVAMCNKIYDKGIWPEDFAKTVIIPIPKKTCTKECESIEQ